MKGYLGDLKFWIPIFDPQPNGKGFCALPVSEREGGMAFMHASQDCVEPRRLAERPIKSTGVGRLGLFVDALVYCSGWGLKGKHQMESQPFLGVSRCFDACPHGGTLSACPTNEAASNFPRCGHMALMFSRDHLTG